MDSSSRSMDSSPSILTLHLNNNNRLDNSSGHRSNNSSLLNSRAATDNCLPRDSVSAMFFYWMSFLESRLLTLFSSLDPQQPPQQQGSQGQLPPQQGQCECFRCRFDIVV